MKSMTLYHKIALGSCAMIVGILVLLGAVLIPERLESYDNELDNYIALAARLVAESNDVRRALEHGAAEEALVERLDADVGSHVGFDYIVIADTNSIRIYHPDHDLIGQQFAGGDEGRAAAGGAPYLTTRQGTQESQRRAFHSVYDDNGQVIGFVMVGSSLNMIQQQKRALIMRFGMVFAMAMMVGLLVSRFLAKSVCRALLGNEPDAFARMFLQRQEVLDHLNECLLAVTAQGSILYANAKGAELLASVGASNLPEAFPLMRQVQEASAEGHSCEDQFVQWGERTYLGKCVPLGEAGVLLVLRDRTEYTRIDQQLTGTNHIIEALRANTHEFLNKLHVILGLLQIGETQQAIEFISEVSDDVEGNYQSIVRQIQNRTVAALVLGKVSHARELGIRLTLRSDSTLPPHSAYLSSDELVTIVGNLVENAFDAVKNSAQVKEVGLFIGEDEQGLTIAVDDTGYGMTEEQIATVRARQYTTKGDGHGFGLRLIQQIVADRKGYLDIASEPSEGSAFTVNFTVRRTR